MTELSGELWPAHPKPLPDELMTSWICRLARANGVKLQAFCDISFGKHRQLWNRDIDRLAPPWLVAELSRRTATPEPRVLATTMEVFRGKLFRRRHAAGQLRWILPIGIFHRTRRRFGLQFCPQCLNLDDEPYFRTSWRAAILTFCARHLILLHDRCPNCRAAVAFHRRELGRPETIDPGQLCLCHACHFDYRLADRTELQPIDRSAGQQLRFVAGVVSGPPETGSVERCDVLHQLCKVMVSLRRPSSLAEFVASEVGSCLPAIPRGRYAFETRPLWQRHTIIQLAAWVLAELGPRLTQAWSAGAVRYNQLLREFESPPLWYLAAVTPLAGGSRRRRH